MKFFLISEEERAIIPPTLIKLDDKSRHSTLDVDDDNLTHPSSPSPQYFTLIVLGHEEQESNLDKCDEIQGC